MKVERLTDEYLKDFVRYCKQYRDQIDQSYLYDSDLDNFNDDDNNPTFFISDGIGRITASASLIIDDYFKNSGKALFRIFHSEKNDQEEYKLLFSEILKHAGGLQGLLIFLPIINTNLIKSMGNLGFMIERYTYVLVREDIPISDISFPQGYSVKTFEPEKDELIWCVVRNEAFANLKGTETPITKEMVSKMLVEEDHIDGGMLIFYENEKPVGIVRGSNDVYEGIPTLFIGPLGIIPEYQGKGLGRNLLRESLRFGKEHGYNQAILCVNAENEKAKALYINEGFKEIESYVCLVYNLIK